MNEQTIEKRASFDFIRYSNCWEDADVLLKALAAKEGGRYLSIGSAGDNVFSILSQNPSKVIAVDISDAQIACIKLRKAAFLNLSHREVLEFFGIKDCKHRINIYQQLKKDIPECSHDFWNANLASVKDGFIHGGKFERYFRLFRKRILPLIHGKKRIRQLLEAKNDRQRRSFYYSQWNTRRWKLLFKVFFSRFVMGRFGRDPEFFKYVEGDIADRIFKRSEYALSVLAADKNPYLEYILRGNFKQSLPFYLRPENFDNIVKNLDKLVIFKGNIQKALDAHKGITFDGFNLSDIFEYMSQEQYKKEVEALLKASKKGSRFVYWNMLVDRSCSQYFKDQITLLKDEAEKLFLEDKAFFYKALIIEEVK